MRYVSFRIRNFRGVTDATIDLIPRGAGILTLIGLNESGKTTVLEAISTFQLRGGDEKSLYQAKPTQQDPSSYVPKNEKATFTGDITVQVAIEFEGDEKSRCIAFAENASGSKIDPTSIPNRFFITRGYKYENGDQIGRINNWSITLLAKAKGKQKFTPKVSHEDPEWLHFSSYVAQSLPEIVYFPTFIFEQPDKIVLNPQSGEKSADRLYRNIIENVGLSLEKPIDIKTNIVDRILIPESAGEAFLGFFSLSNNRQQQIESAVNQISQRLSSTVLDSWARIFGGSNDDREIRLKLGVDKFPDGAPRVYVQFSVRDGMQPYDISERSLGFRWFFAFLLFTLYRNDGKSAQKTMFLLDEPASNLHAGAQNQLLESFPRITKDGNVLVYSTHSHYMINPEWLDQAYIISNDAVSYGDVGDLVVSMRNTDISATKYRTFVGRNADMTTYFQPVLDRLQVIPSRLDMLQPSVIVEGKGDYLILTYGLFISGAGNKYAIIPTRGADGFSELVGILLGWGVNFAVCFDDDPKGAKRCREYRNDWALSESRAYTLKDCHGDLAGKAIEGLLESADLNRISEHYGISAAPSKSQIQLFFSEKLALKEKVDLSATFLSRVAAFDERAKLALGL